MRAAELKIHEAGSQVWEQLTDQDVKRILAVKMDSAAFKAWIAPLKVLTDQNKATLVAANKFNFDFIRSTFGNAIAEAAKDSGIDIELSFDRPALHVIQRTAANIDSKSELSMMRNSEVFSDFVCSEANQFAVSAVKKCASGFVPFSPLVVYGPVGSGKSLLLDMLRQSTNLRVVSTTGAQFVTDFIRAMQTNTVFAFKDAMRNCDTFVMDDISGLAGKRASADEFLVLLEELVRMKKNIVITSGIAPSQITGFDKRLVSILASGLTVDLAAPCASIAEKILLASGMPIGVAKKISGNVPANGHIISGICKKVAAWLELDCGELSDSVLERLLGDVLVKQKTPTAVVKSMCAKLGVSFDEVMSSTRARSVVFARQKIMAVLKMSTNLTLSEIGMLVGGRDHASVLYAISQIEKTKESDLLLDAELKQLSVGN